MDTQHPTMSVSMAAQQLRCSERTVRRYIQKYAITTHYEYAITGRKVAIPQGEMDRLTDILSAQVSDRMPKGGGQVDTVQKPLPSLLNGHRDEVKLLLVEAIREAFSGLPVAQPLKQSGWEIGARVAWYLAAVVTLGAAAGALLG